MTIGLLLLPAVGGYWFLTHWNFTRYRAARQSGYHLLFRSALFGIVLYCAARFITLAIDVRYPSATGFWDDHFPEPFTSEVVVSLVLAVLIPPVFNLFYSKDRGAEKVAEDSGDHIELLIADSIRNPMPIEVTLRNRKSYIGLALNSGIGSTTEADIELVPMYSGYRDKETLDLEITLDYVPVVSDYLEDPAWLEEDFRVVIPLSEIVSVRLFDEEAYDEFQGWRDIP